MLIVCTHCLTTNRIAPERTGEDPVCGRCKRPLLDGLPVELRDDNFEAVTSKTEMPIVVDVWADWCGPCHMMAPHFQQAAEKLKGRVLLAKLDSDANPQTSNRFAIRSLPTMLMLQGGREVKRQAGAMGAGQILAWIGAGG